jgi:hypothetical protein
LLATFIRSPRQLSFRCLLDQAVCLIAPAASGIAFLDRVGPRGHPQNLLGFAAEEVSRKFCGILKGMYLFKFCGELVEP